MLLEERAELGWLPSAAGDGSAELPSELESTGARVLLGTAALGVFGGPLVAAADGEALYRIRARHLVFATGAVEQGAVFPNNDLPGVMLSSAVELLVRRYGVLPGRRAVVLTSGDEGYEAARTLRDAGAEATVVDLRPDAKPIDGIAVDPRVDGPRGRRTTARHARWSWTRPASRAGVRSPRTSSCSRGSGRRRRTCSR